MNSYSISFVEQLSGIKAHTLRIWEQRYPLFEANRTETNIRFYDDEQLKKVLNISVLIQHGFRIGQISKWSKEEFQKRLHEITQSQMDIHITYAHIINQLIASSLTYNEQAFSITYANAVNEFGTVDMYIKILYPMVVRIGMLWSSSDLIPAQEHFISSLLKQKMMYAIEQTPIPENGKTCVLFLPEEEEHELGLLFAAFLLKSAGYKVIYLGPKVPLVNVKQTATVTNADLLLWFVVKHTPLTKVQEILLSLETSCKGVRQVICAHPFQTKGILLTKQTVMVQNPAELIPVVNTLFKRINR